VATSVRAAVVPLGTPVVAASRALCNRVCVDQDGPASDFSAIGRVIDDRVTVTVTGEVDMSTADTMYQAATRENAKAATLDLTAVTFFDSAAIHALIRIAERYPGALDVVPSPQVLRVLDISGLSGQPWLRQPE
jgi:anti-anti-sigma factor